MPQGGNFDLNVAMENSDRTPKNLTGYSGRMQVRSTVASSTVLMEATTANGRITITPLTGLVSVRSC